MEKRFEFDEAALLSALAVGVPGKRTFFVAVGQKGKWVRLWLEKEELQALALAVRRLFLTISQRRLRLSPAVDMTSEDTPSGLPSAELEMDEISLGYDGQMARLVATVRVLGPQRLDHAELRCGFTLSQLKRFGEQAEAVCAAGRPRCPLCGGAVDPTGHICPRSN